MYLEIRNVFLYEDEEKIERNYVLFKFMMFLVIWLFNNNGK